MKLCNEIESDEFNRPSKQVLSLLTVDEVSSETNISDLD